MQCLEIETGKTCEACSIVHWEGTCRRQEVLSPCPCHVNGSYKSTYTKKYVSSFSRASNLFFITVLKILVFKDICFFSVSFGIFFHKVGPQIEIRHLDLFDS